MSWIIKASILGDVLGPDSTSNSMVSYAVNQML